MKKSKVILSLILLTGILILSTIIKIMSDHSERYASLTDVASLSFEDFYGIPDFFKDYDAAISTNIQLSKKGDSIYAETILDKYQSWAKVEAENDSYLLIHEKYHALITHYGTSLLNNLIQQETLSFKDSEIARDSILHIVNQLQTAYDEQTNHNQNEENQIYWEYKIDSLIQVSKSFTDNETNFDGSSVFFSSEPKREIYKDPNTMNSVSYTSKNGIHLEIQTLYDIVYDFDMKIYEEHYKENNFKDIRFDSIDLDGQSALKIVAIDSTMSTEIVDVFIPNKDRTYKISTFYPNDVLKFRAISDNFINSFRIKDDTQFWKNYYDKNRDREVWEITPSKNIDEEVFKFTKSSSSDFALIHARPFVYNEKLLIPFKPISHELEDIEQILAIINEKEKVSTEIDSSYQIIPIELAKLKNGINHIQIGYIPKEKDSITSEYHHFYSTQVYFENQKK